MKPQPTTTKPARPQPLRTAAQVRRDFIDWFVRKLGHTFVPSSPVVPHGDPTLLFTNAGMNQFKPIFLGHVEPGSPFAALRRAVNSQKCIRAGGKHNDLEDVGRDHYHHTFFEMLGNWSFGDYFKDEAIAWAWELLTGRPESGGFGLDAGRLHVTVFAGDEADGLAPDEEAEALWGRHVPAERISRWPRKDNFWEMGATGPCGPCSEIHYDFTPDGSGAPLVNAGDPRVVELWNLVFIQFNRSEGGRLAPLPQRHVDTGMGLERLVRVLQHKESNYATDLFVPIFRAIEAHTREHPYRGSLEDPVDVAYRVIADHTRCLVAAITDGAWPSNEGRGYVLRRILRRAVRHGHRTLGVEGPVLCELVDGVVQTLGDAFPEMRENPARVAAVIRDEETSFLRTLDRGLALFDEAAERAGRAPRRMVGAEDAFRLHDTYGFPIDLTRVIAAERGLEVDEAGYERLMEEARARSRQAAGAGEAMMLTPDALARLRHLGVGPTDDAPRHDLRPVAARVEAIYNGRDLDERAHVGRRVAVILNRTGFYAEAGGQVGDRGELRTGAADFGTLPVRGRSLREGRPEARFEVQDTQAFGGYVLHIGHVTEGELRARDHVTAVVDRAHREPVLANHTATHLLNFALREVVGPEEDQKGSLVAPDRLRFDFSCSHPMTDEQIGRSEAIVNEAINQRKQVHAAVMDLAVARSIAGIRAVFGEKYPDPVRVVTIGCRPQDILADPRHERWRGFSIELCGGTHLPETGAARRFVIVHEQALAAGVRRITALTGHAAEAAEACARALAGRVAQAERLDEGSLEAELDEIVKQVEAESMPAVARKALQARLEPLRERVRAVRKRKQAESRAGVVEEARALSASASGPAIVLALGGTDRQELLAALDAIRAGHAEAAVMLVGADGESVAIVARVPGALIERGLRAGDWVRQAAEACGGRGGGRPDMAQAGGRDPGRVTEAIEAARAWAKRTLG